VGGAGRPSARLQHATPAAAATSLAGGHLRSIPVPSHLAALVMASAPSDPKSCRWSDMVEEEDDEFVESEGSLPRLSYFDVVRDGMPSPERSVSPPSPQGGPVAARSPPARQLASVVSRPAQPRADGGYAPRGVGGRRGPQAKRQRHRDLLPSSFGPAGIPAGLTGLCFNCAEPGHVAG
jgi:hypothetical protein